MTKTQIKYRPALSAIVALTALSSSPALAQVADPLAATSPVEQAAPTVTSDPLSPETTAVEAAPTTATDSASPASTPKVEPVPEETAATTAVAAKKAAKPAARAPITRGSARNAAASSASTLAPPAAVPSLAAEPAPAPTIDPAAAMVPPVEPVVADAPIEASQPATDILPYAGAAGLGLLAILGIGLVLRRRRNRIDEDGEQFDLVTAAPVETPEPEFRREPVAERSAFARDRAHQPAPTANAAATEVPAGFDISRFGRHVQAAYRGPTTDNPSLSLKKRLKRASFFDMKERVAAKASSMARPAATTGFAFTRAKLAFQY